MTHRELLESGKSCIPCGLNKKCILDTWKEFQTRYPTPAEVQAWEKRNPASWAVLTGRISDLVILDFDGEEGSSTMRKLCLEPNNKTPSDGFHVWVNHPGGYVGNKQANKDKSKRFPGMDVRGEGGYAITQGRNETGEYEWLSDKVTPWDSLPNDLKAYLLGDSNPKAEQATKNPTVTFTATTGITDRILENALNDAPSSRECSLYNLARQCQAHDVSESDTLALGEAFISQASNYDAHGKYDPITQSTIQQQVRSAYSKTPMEPWESKTGWEPETAAEPSKADGKEPERSRGKNTQLGNAQLLIDKHGDNIRYNVDAGAWHVYDGKRWAEDKTGVVRRLAADVIDSLYEQLKNTTDSDESRKLLQHILRSKKDSEINGMLNLARDAVSETIPVRQTAFDQNPMLFNCGNVTIDLDTIKTRPHNPADMLSKQTETTYDPAAQCPRWIQFLGEVFPDQDGSPDVEAIKYMQRLSGYFLTGLTREQKIWILYGKGGAGKGIFVKTISKVLGEYAAPVMRSAILEKPAGSSGSDNQNLTDVVGNRLIHCSEFDKRDRLDKGLVKAMSGEDTLKMRRHCQHAFSYQPTYKLLLLTNHIPSFDGAESGMRRRIVVIPFLSKFYEPEEGLCPVADNLLDKKLEAETPGILNWMLEGLREYLQLGNLGKTPQAIKRASAEVLSDQDVLSDWLSDNCNEGWKYSAKLKELWADYSTWCNDNNRVTGFKDSRGFSKNLVERDGINRNGETRDGSLMLSGIGLKADSCVNAEDAEDNHEFPIGSHEGLNIQTDMELPLHPPHPLQNTNNPEQIGLDDMDTDFHTALCLMCNKQYTYRLNGNARLIETPCKCGGKTI